MSNSFGAMSHAHQQQEIIALTRGRTCRACPTTHVNTGNIIYHQQTKIKGKKVSWPGWTTQLIQIVVQTINAQGEYEIRKIQTYEQANIIAPDVNQSYNHVGIHTANPSKTQHINDKKTVTSMYEDMNIPKDRSAFWCMKNAKRKLMFIFQVDYVPHNPILYRDVNLLDRKDSHMFFVKSLPSSSHEPVHTPSGIIHVLDDDNKDPAEVAMNLSAQLMYNCRP